MKQVIVESLDSDKADCNYHCETVEFMPVGSEDALYIAISGKGFEKYYFLRNIKSITIWDE